MFNFIFKEKFLFDLEAKDLQLPDIPNSLMSIWMYKGVIKKNEDFDEKYIYFDTEEDLKEFIDNNNIGEFDGVGLKLDYLGSFAGKRNVIMVTSIDGFCDFFCHCSGYHHYQYNCEESSMKKKNVWDCYNSTHEEFYYPFIKVSDIVRDYIINDYGYELKRIDEIAIFKMKNNVKIKSLSQRK